MVAVDARNADAGSPVKAASRIVNIGLSIGDDGARVNQDWNGVRGARIPGVDGDKDCARDAFRDLAFDLASARRVPRVRRRDLV